MIFLQYKEIYMVLVDYPTIVGEDIKYYVKKAIRNLLHENINVYSRRLIDEFPGYLVKCISKLQSHYAKMTFSENIRYDRLSQQVTHKEGELAMKHIKRFKISQDLSVSLGNIYTKDYLMNILLDNFHQGGKYTPQIASHQI